MVKNSPGNSGDADFDSWVGKTPGGGNSNPPQYSCLENPMDRETWRAAVHGGRKSRTQLSIEHTQFIH